MFQFVRNGLRQNLQQLQQALQLQLKQLLLLQQPTERAKKKKLLENATTVQLKFKK
jgi:hypothetical protein